MRMSCNGCRVLRKGCSDSCTIRPCLEWIKTAESQANATVFLAKFYGRAGLMNLINAGPQHLRPAIFRSLLYEACGRIVNPTYGSVGLLWSGNWQICQAAVDCILKGCPILPISANSFATPPPIVPSEFEATGSHVAGRAPSPRSALMETIARELHKVKTKSRFKSVKKTSGDPSSAGRRNRREALDDGAASQVCNLRWRRCYPGGFVDPPSLVTMAELPVNLPSSDSSSECEHRCSCVVAESNDRQNIPAEDSVDQSCRGPTLTRTGNPRTTDAKQADRVPEDEFRDLSSDDVEVQLELRLGSPVSSDHEKLASSEHFWSPVSTCLGLGLTRFNGNDVPSEVS